LSGIGKLIAIVVGLILGGFCFYWFLLNFFLSNWSQRALFGESFGALNSLISGLTLAGLVIALFLQIREVHLQNQELQLQRREIEDQNERLEMQRVLIAFSTYLQTRSETRATFGDSITSDEAKERLLKANLVCSLMVDKILQGTQLPPEQVDAIRLPQRPTPPSSTQNTSLGKSAPRGKKVAKFRRASLAN
jgi:uncharacterized membrane protein